MCSVIASGKPLRRLQHARQLGARLDVALVDPTRRCAARRRRARSTRAARSRAPPAACGGRARRAPPPGSGPAPPPAATALRARSGSCPGDRSRARCSGARPARPRTRRPRPPDPRRARPAARPASTRCPTRASRSVSTAASRRSVAAAFDQSRWRTRPRASPASAGRSSGVDSSAFRYASTAWPTSASARSAMSPMRAQAAPTALGIGRRGDRQPVGRDRVGGPPDLGLDLGQADQRRHRRRIQRHRLAQHRRRLDRIALVDQIRERQQAIAPLRHRPGGGAPAHHLRQPIGVAAARAG